MRSEGVESSYGTLDRLRAFAVIGDDKAERLTSRPGQPYAGRMGQSMRHEEIIVEFRLYQFLAWQQLLIISGNADRPG